MLSLSNVSLSMASNYFSADDYYSPEKGEVDVYGKTSKAIGLNGKLTPKEFDNLLAGFSPDGKTKLGNEKRKCLAPEDIQKSKIQFVASFEKLKIPSGHIDFLLQEIDAKLGENTAHDRIFSLSAEQKRSFEGIAKLSLKKWGIVGSEATKAHRSIEKLTKIIAPESRRAATDMTFSAPKSISIASLVGGDKALVDAHKQSVDYALSYIENNFIGTKIEKNGRSEFIPTGNMVAAKFLHGTSREGDPQLHTHCIVFNLTKRLDQKWGATNNDEVYKNSKLLGVLYKNKLAELVQKIGYEISPTGDGSFELSGYSKEQLKAFSKRRQQVLEGTAKLLYKRESDKSKTFEEVRVDLVKMANAKLNRAGVYEGRKSKKELPAKDLKEKWLAESNELAIKHPTKNGHSKWGDGLDLSFATDHLGERKAIFLRKEAELHSLIRNIGRADFSTIKGELNSQKKFIIADGNRGIATTYDQVKTEVAILRKIRDQHKDFTPLGSLEDANRISKKRKYTSDQAKAFKFSMTNREQFSLWNGVAGAGKSYALRDLKEAAERTSTRVFALAPDAVAARELGKSINAQSSTVHRFLYQKTKIDGAIIIVDEATKLSTKQMNSLMDRAIESDSRVIFVGDRRQFGSVEAGAPFEAMYQRCAKIDLLEHQRQKDPALKKAVEMASQQTQEGLQNSLKALRENIVERKTKVARENLFVKEFVRLSPQEREKTLLIADLNHDRRALTLKLREQLKLDKVISTDESVLKILVPKDLTEAQKRYAESFEKGDIVIGFSKDSPLKAGERYEIANSTEGKLILKESNGQGFCIDAKTFHGNVYRLEDIKVATGDILEWRKNQKDILNRDVCTVIKAGDTELVLKTGDRITTLDPRQPQHLDYGLVRTAYSSQGATADRVLALTTANSSMQSWYVTISRARHDIKVITDDRNKLEHRIFTSVKQKNALDHLKKEEWEQHKTKIKELNFRGRNKGLDI